MKYNTIIAAVVIIASIASHIRSALAEMEDKTKAEIAEESILIVRGEVLLVERFKLLDEYISIYKATVAISDVVKGVPETGSGNKVSIFFRNATQEGVYAEHSPRLKAGDKCVFYSKVKQGIIEGKEVYWLDSAKRVEPSPQPDK